MTSDEPWRYFGTAMDRSRDADEKTCTNLGGDEGYVTITLREEAIERRRSLPGVLWIDIERRYVTRTAWQRDDDDDDEDLIPAAYRRNR